MFFVSLLWLFILEISIKSITEQSSPILIPSDTPHSFLTSFGVTSIMETVLNGGSASGFHPDFILSASFLQSGVMAV